MHCATTVHSWAVELSQADHSVLRLLQISQQHIEFLGWRVKWSRRDSPVWVVGSLEKSIRVPSVSQKWGHNWSVWSMSVSFGRRWLNVANNNHFSVLGCSIIYVMDYGLSWHGNPGNHFPRSYSTISSAAFQAGSVHEGANVSGALPALWQQPSSSFVQVSQNSIGIWHRHWNLAMEKGVEDWRLL